MIAPLRADSSERVVLVDAHDRAIGTADKLTAHELGQRHRALSVFIYRSDGAMLLQRRAVGKYHSGGLWSNACCSHPRAGEDTLAAAHRRLAEEMGLRCALEPALTLLYHASLGNGLVEHEFDHVFRGVCDDAPIPDPTEVDAWRWAPMSQLLRDVAWHPQDYTIWFRVLLPTMLAVDARPAEATPSPAARRRLPHLSRHQLQEV